MRYLPAEEIEALVTGNHGSPYSILGIREVNDNGKGVIIRAFHPYAVSVDVVKSDNGDAMTMTRIHEDGLYELFLEGWKPFAYKFRITDFDQNTWEAEDPYRFPLQISDFDRHLIGEGTGYQTYKVMGAHTATIEGIQGVHFAVWAPNAVRMSVIGWFNRWDGRSHPMQRRGDSGLWELFVPALQPGDLYKFEVKGQNDYLAQKADPYAFYSELRPRSASVVWDLDHYQWNDAAWMAHRKKTDWFKEPVSVYEVHLGSWRKVPEDDSRSLTYRELADQLIPYVKDLGYTHIELMPISEHPFDGSWGYQTIGYYAPTSRFGSPDDFRYFVDRCHQEGIGVIVDWVPAHFPKDGHGLAYFDGTHLYEHADPRKGEHKDWGTLIFNYGRNEVRTFLLSNAIFLADVYHIDGLRVDAVASMLYLDYSREEGEWIPNQFGGRENLEAVDFLKHFNEVIHGNYPGMLTFAEESTAWPMVSRPVYLGGLGFDLKWNMGWMHDTLEYFVKEPIHRKYHHNNLTFSLLYAFSENFILPFSHDEVVHGKRAMLDKMPGDDWQRFANARILYSYMFAHPGKKLLFMGAEFGQWKEWNYHESLDWHLLDYDPHQKLMRLIRDLNYIYKGNHSLYDIDFTWEGFEWIDYHDWEQSIISFVRKGHHTDDQMICAFNLTPVPREQYRVGVNLPGEYELVLNSDAAIYGGSDVQNPQRLVADPQPCQDRNFSLLLTLPPLGALYYRYVKPGE